MAYWSVFGGAVGAILLAGLLLILYFESGTNRSKRAEAYLGVINEVADILPFNQQLALVAKDSDADFYSRRTPPIKLSFIWLDDRFPDFSESIVVTLNPAKMEVALSCKYSQPDFQAWKMKWSKLHDFYRELLRAVNVHGNIVAPGAAPTAPTPLYDHEAEQNSGRTPASVGTAPEHDNGGPSHADG